MILAQYYKGAPRKKPGNRKPLLGRPPIDMNEDLVFKLAAIHCTYEEIAAFFNVDRTVIFERFQDVVKRGKEVGKISVRRLQIKAARRGSIPMLIWLGKQLLGQQENVEVKDESTMKKVDSMLEALMKFKIENDKAKKDSKVVSL